MSIGRLKVSLLMLVSIGIVDTSSAFDNVDEQRFLNEYPAAAESFVKKLAMSSGTIESIPVGKSANKGKRTYAFRRDHGCEKVDVFSDMKLNGKSRNFASAYVYCEDEKSFYALTKRPEDDGYLVQSLGTSARDFASYRASVGKLMTVPLGSAKSLVLSVLNADGRVIEEVAPEPSNPKLMRVRLSAPQKDKEATKHTLSFVLDPENHWAVVSEERAIGGKFPSVHQMEVEYGPKVDGFAMPAKVKFSRDGAPDSEFRYADWQFVPTGRDEFRPAKYDLPDLPLAKGRRIPTFAYVVIALIVTLSILGWYLFEVSKRSSKSA
jgi:hypothetical protein